MSEIQSIIDDVRNQPDGQEHVCLSMSYERLLVEELTRAQFTTPEPVNDKLLKAAKKAAQELVAIDSSDGSHIYDTLMALIAEAERNKPSDWEKRQPIYPAEWDEQSGGQT